MLRDFFDMNRVDRVLCAVFVGFTALTYPMALVKLILALIQKWR